MKINIKHRFTGEVIFSCDAESISVAVILAFEAKANLSYANLHGANLHGANLSYADLHGANLYGANLYGADLSGADLHGANLSYADLHGANLHGANLRCAYLHGADLHGADLRGADLHGANLRCAELSGADLSGADVFYATPSVATSNYMIFATCTHIKIGCQFHSLKDWLSFNDRRIAEMDGKRALKFWKLWKPILQEIATERGWLNAETEVSEVQTES